MLPLIGFALLVLPLQKVKSLFSSSWMDQGPGAIFFVKPSGWVASYLWDLYMETALLMSAFFACGTDNEGVEHTWYDAKTTKDYWRGLFEHTGAAYPRCIGRWNLDHYEPLHSLDKINDRRRTAGVKSRCDVIVKIPDSYLGIGDAFFPHTESEANIS